LLLHLAIDGIDELMLHRESETQRQQEIETLRQKLADAERRIERLYLELNGRSLAMGN
jgi:predicted RNase H-like nuclease (RuvC/YqgF family)